MGKRIIAIVFIFLCTSVAWLILGVTIFNRTYSAHGHLGDRVVSIWGAQQRQPPPDASFTQLVPKTAESTVGGVKKTEPVM